MQKRIIVLILVATMLVSVLFIGTAAASDSSDTIRVKLSMGSPTSISFFIDGNYSVAEDGSIMLDRELYTVKLESETLCVYYGSTLIFSGSTFTLIQHAPTSGLNNFIWVDNNKYGYLSYVGNFAFAIDNNSIQAVNQLYLEDYIYGVVPYEMSDSWSLEALKAQAVAARSYAYNFTEPGDSFDVGDTSSDQVFKGYNALYTNTINAVNSTTKQVVTYDGTPICTYFTASNGGWTEIPLHVWSGGKDVPYYQIVEDTFDTENSSSLYETVFFPIVIDADHPITTSDNVSGTPDIVNAEAYIKQAIVQSGKLSHLGVVSDEDFALTGVTDLNSHTPDTDGAYNDRISEFSSIECMDYVMATGSFNVSIDDVPAVAEDIQLDLRYFDASNGIDTYKVFNKDSLRIFIVRPVSNEGTVTGYTISQLRYGHGIGLSQRGAQHRANSGHSYQDIISFYYPGTSISQLAIVKPLLTAINTASSTNGSVVNVTKSVNVRSGPSTSYSKIGTLPNGARVNVADADENLGWCRIIYGEANAYIYMDYVSLDTNYIGCDIIDGKLNRTFYNDDGSIKKVTIYHGTSITSGVYKVNYYTDGVRTSYRLYNSSGELTNIVELYSNGKVKKLNYYSTSTGKRTSYKLYDLDGRMTHLITCYSDGIKPKKTNYYNVSTGVRTSYKLYDTQGRTTHLISCHPDGIKPKKTNYYDVNTGGRTSYKLYDTSGRMTHYALCYSDGISAKKMNYYNVNTGIRSAYKTYRTNGSLSSYATCDSKGNPSIVTYYDENGNVIKVVEF